MNDSSIYQLIEVRKNHGPAFTLQIANLHVQRSEVIALLGPTGAGKSTLLRLLAGLESSDSGEIRFEGRPLNASSVSMTTRRRITLLHQRPLLLTGTVRFNVEYGLRLRGTKNVSSKVDAMLNRLGLPKLASQSAHSFRRPDTACRLGEGAGHRAGCVVAGRTDRQSRSWLCLTG